MFAALEQMFEHDRSTARGQICTRGLYLSKHGSELGNAHANALFERSRAKRDPPVDVPREFSAYSVLFDGRPVAAGKSLPAAPGVTLIRRC